MVHKSVLLFLTFVSSVTISYSQQPPDALLPPGDLTENKSPATAGGKEAIVLLTSAESLLSAGKSESAISQYQQAVSLDPRSFTAQSRLGIAYCATSNYRAAVSSLLRANELKPDDPIGLDYLAYAYFMLREPEKAKIYYQRLISLTPESAANLSNLGYTYLALKNYADGKAAFEKALTLDPDHKQATGGLCFVYDADGTAENGAIDVCTKAVHLDPTSAQASYMLGFAYLYSNHHEEALRWFRKAQELEPGNALVQLAMGRAHLTTKQYEDAAQDFARAAEISPEMKAAYTGLGVAHFRLKHLKQATTYFTRALQIDPSSETARFNLGVICLVRQQRECALQQYNALKIADSALADKLFRGLFDDRILDVRKK